MDRYVATKALGSGSYGHVWQAINKQTREVVAIKRLKKTFDSWEECLNLPEVKSLRAMNHPNIVKLKEVVQENHVLYFIFEYMHGSLYQLMQAAGKPFSEEEIQNWCFQIFRALSHMHQRGFFHRDLKPDNLLVTGNTIKIADFGFAREVGSQEPYTTYVVTRWFRAPELLLESSVYGPAVDMWAMGAIMAEMFTQRALFPGLDEADQMNRICRVMGSPDSDSWPEGLAMANAIGYRFPQFERADLSMLIPSASKEAIHLISLLCSWDPSKRPDAGKVLGHSFFLPVHLRPSRMPASNVAPAVNTDASKRRGAQGEHGRIEKQCSNRVLDLTEMFAGMRLNPVTRPIYRQASQLPYGMII